MITSYHQSCRLNSKAPGFNHEDDLRLGFIAWRRQRATPLPTDLSAALYSSTSYTLRKRFAAYHIPLHPLEATWKRKVLHSVSAIRVPEEKEKRLGKHGAEPETRASKLRANIGPLADTLASPDSSTCCQGFREGGREETENSGRSESGPRPGARGPSRSINIQSRQLRQGSYSSSRTIVRCRFKSTRGITMSCIMLHLLEEIRV
ncbi:hypothetical protein BJX68DRAFT_223165 [Aspergillus pseudodeflectus]|uniref:Uncharacterized protein n=1 Tax=Aspergillus pseudodeflectus TaxID=176178 RepID=A0ABR4LB98_9EURO